MKLYFPITVDLYNPHPLPRMNAQQHNVGRGALITLTANGQIIVPDEETVRIFARRPDKNTSYLDCSILEGKIQADFTDQMLAAEGIVEVELELTTAETNITTPIFIVEVNKSNVKEGVQSSNEYKALEKYTAEAKEAAEQAQEVYDNIPNYEAILEANSILSKASGEVVTTTDSAKVKPKNIKLFGKGKQNTIPGNQLLSKITAEEMGGTLSDDGTTVTSAVKTGTSYINLLRVLFDDIVLEAGKTYYVSMDLKLSSGSLSKINNIQVMDSANGVIGKITNVSVPSISNAYQRYIYSFTSEEEVTARKIYVQGYNGTDAVVTATNFMISENTYEWEPYVGNEPSPNMNYPQKAEFLGESGSITNKLLTSNIYNPSHRNVLDGINGIACNVTESNGVFKAVATGTDIMIWAQANEGETYNFNMSGFLQSIPSDATEISVTVTNEKMKKQLISFYDTNKVSLGWSYYATNRFTAQIPEGAKYFSLRLGNGEAVVGETYEFSVMANYGQPMDYEPYTEQPFTFQTPNGLRGIPLGQTIPDAIKNSPIHMSGVYWDSVEQQYYIGDTENENGKDVQRVLKVTIDGNSDVFDYNNPLDTSNIFGFSINGIVKDTQVLCDKLTNRGVWSKDINGIWVGANNAISIRLNNNLTGITTEDTSSQKVAKVKELLTNNPIEIYYWSIIDPIITGTTEEEKAQLDALVMNYPNTTIVNDAGAYMEVEYVCDTKEHIKQNYTPKSVTEDILERLGNVESQIALNS